MHKQNWDDLRFVLAVAESGSVSQAAQLLGVNHATVLRRVAEFELRHGVTVFEKTRRGYRVLADKRDVIKAAKAAEAAITTVEELAGGRVGSLRGRTRVTSTDTFCQLILPGIVSEMQSRSTDLYVEIVSSNAHVDLIKRRIDIAIRPSIELAEGLEGERVAVLGFAVYAREVASEDWLGLSGSLERSVGAGWMVENVRSDRIVASADSFHVLRELAAVGHGKTVLPCFIGDADPRLQRADAGMPHFQVPIWIANHVDAANSSRVRMLRGEFAKAFGNIQEKLKG